MDENNNPVDWYEFFVIHYVHSATRLRIIESFGQLQVCSLQATKDKKQEQWL